MRAGGSRALVWVEWGGSTVSGAARQVLGLIRGSKLVSCAMERASG